MAGAIRPLLYTSGVERQIIFSVFDFLVFSGLIVAIFGLFSIIAGDQLRKFLLKGGTKEKKDGGEKKIILLLFGSLIGVAFLATLGKEIFGKSEKNEWFVYEVGSIAVFFISMWLARKRWVIKGWLEKLAILSFYLGLFSLIIFLTFYSKWSLVFFIFGLSIFWSKFYKRKNYVYQLLFNLTGIFLVIGFFIVQIRSLSLPTTLTICFLWIAAWGGYFWFKRVNYSNNFKMLASRAMWGGLFLVELLPKTQKLIDYHHFSFYIGPVYELALGKSILSEVPSQYGYLSIHFIRWGLGVINRGINFESFHLFHTLLLMLYFGGFYLAYKKLFENKFLVFLFTATTVLLQTCLQQYGGLNLPPSTGPVRFMFGLLIVLSLWLIPKRKIKLFVVSALGAISTFWSVETAVYIVPALVFLFAVESQFFAKKGSLKIARFVKSTASFFGIALIFGLIIFFEELGRYGTKPSVSNFLQYANVYKSGFGAIPFPPFGNHFLVIAALIWGLFYFFYFSGKLARMKRGKGYKERALVVAGLGFLATHNVAIFSYFVSRSAYTNIINIMPFVLLQIAMVLSLFKKKNKMAEYYLIPTVLFFTLFLYSCFTNILHQPEIRDGYANKNKVLREYEILKEKYNLSGNNVLILSKSSDTLLILEEKINNKLPFNPALMTSLLPNFEEKYIVPNLENIPNGTVLVYGNDFREVYDILGKYFYLEQVEPKISTVSARIDDLTLYTMSRIE